MNSVHLDDWTAEWPIITNKNRNHLPLHWGLP